MSVGRALRSIRVMMNMTGEELAKRAGLVKYGNLTRIENDENDPNIDTLERICKALKVPSYMVLFLAAKDDELDWSTGIPEKLSVELVKLMRKNVVKGNKPIRGRRRKCRSS